jgi:hypothetical protein
MRARFHKWFLSFLFRPPQRERRSRPTKKRYNKQDQNISDTSQNQLLLNPATTPTFRILPLAKGAVKCPNDAFSRLTTIEMDIEIP